MLKLLRDQLLEVVRAIAPLVLVVIILQLALVKAPGSLFAQFLISTLMVIAGMALFLLGIKVGLLPAGETIGAELPQRLSAWLIVGITFTIGFATTIAEPDVIVLSEQASIIPGEAISDTLLVYILGIGVAFFAAMAMIRIVLGFPIKYLLSASYLIVIVLSFFTPAGFVSLAFDSGAVTTGVLTAPILIALGLGMSSVLAGRSAMADGFGILGLASVGPIIAVMVAGIIIR